ncbi:torsin-1A-like [Antennarius striatus]|uniref:torsin-1A-like n=1 Tax=Antennarius striatus TaxID=241820 RepID=UPI0035AEDC69
MKAEKVFLFFNVLLAAAALATAFDPVITAAVVGAVFATTFVGNHFFGQRETCDAKWVSFNAKGLEANLENKLFGQHLASRVILNSVRGFMNDENPQKPLVLSLQGRTGTGKNFVSRIIAENIYREGMNSSFVHVFTSEFHFPHKEKVELYKHQLQKEIRSSVETCGRSMFIFDEMDEMHPGLINTIKPFLDHHNKLGGISYRKAIFIFLSNAGGEEIKQKALDFWKEGRPREEMTLKDLEEFLSASAFNKGGFWHSGLIHKNLVDFFVPFLPLEYGHVVQCVLAEMKSRGFRPDKEVADRMIRDLVFIPKPNGVFSASGCKTIRQRLNFYI